MSKETGGSAFPVATETRRDGTTVAYPEPGMTLRDYFAAQAVIGLIANPANSGDSTALATISYGIADSMLEARK